jgi:hypothetical protein
MIKIHIYWSDDEFNPSVAIMDRNGAFNLWWCLIGNPTLPKEPPISKPYAIRVELYDILTNRKIDPKKGIHFCLSNVYHKP